MFGRQTSDEAAPRRAGHVTFQWASVTDTVGGERADAEGTAGSGSTGGSLILTVADGFGTAGTGHEASRRAVEAATAAPIEDGVSVVDRLRAGDEAVVEFARSRDDARESISTLTIAEFTPHATLNVAHVGDSRLYVFAGSDLVQVTTDHVAPADAADAGVHQRDVVGDRSRRLTSACGLLGLSVQHIADLELEPGDRVLMCTDAISRLVPDDGLSGLLTGGNGAESTARDVIASAGRAGAIGIVTVAVVDIGK